MPLSAAGKRVVMAMQFQQNIELGQRQILSQALRQSLQYLQMPITELAEYLQEQCLSNPLLEVDYAPAAADFTLPISVVEGGGIQGSRRSSESPASDAFYASSRPESFSEYLMEQVNCMQQVDETTRAVCCFLIECLDSTGYLSCSLPELARELELPLYDVEQALYLLQMLEPAGVGARDVTECLLLQLAQGKNFTAANIRMIREGLPLLAKRDYAALSQLLGLPLKAVYESEAVIKALNPIPSRGFYSGDTYHNYIVPEATVLCRDGQLTVEMNTRSLPRISLSPEYTAMLGHAEGAEVQNYLRKRLTAAKATIAQIDSRQSTLQTLLLVILRRQQGYFMGTDQLQPMTMQQVADEMQLNTSTVSRAVKDKYIQFQTRLIPLRSLFSSSLQGDDGALVSADAARQQLRLFIRTEDPAAPLSDEALTAALASVGIHLSRRTVAKYRAELSIPSAAARKRDNRNRT